MGCFELIVLIVFLAFVAAVTGIGVGGQGRGRGFRQVCDRFGGTFQRGRLLRPSSVRFRYGRTWVTVASIQRRRKGPGTQTTMAWPGAGTDLQIEARQFGTSGLAAGSAAVFETGDRSFDDHFTVVAGDSDDASRLLSEGVRWELEKLRQFLGRLVLRVSFRNGRLVIKKPVLIRRGEDLVDFTQLCLDLFDQAMLTRSEGIEFVAGDEAQPIEDPICQICGEAIVEDMVFCRRCMTPHHRDCWRYYGACSTYGCHETRFTTPTVASRVENPPDGGQQPSRGDSHTDF